VRAYFIVDYTHHAHNCRSSGRPLLDEYPIWTRDRSGHITAGPYATIGVARAELQLLATLDKTAFKRCASSSTKTRATYVCSTCPPELPTAELAGHPTYCPFKTVVRRVNNSYRITEYVPHSADCTSGMDVWLRNESGHNDAIIAAVHGARDQAVSLLQDATTKFFGATIDTKRAEDILKKLRDGVTVQQSEEARCREQHLADLADVTRQANSFIQHVDAFARAYDATTSAPESLTALHQSYAPLRDKFFTLKTRLKDPIVDVVANFWLNDSEYSDLPSTEVLAFTKYLIQQAMRRKTPATPAQLRALRHAQHASPIDTNDVSVAQASELLSNLSNARYSVSMPISPP